jgi:hypothetical protein
MFIHIMIHWLIFDRDTYVFWKKILILKTKVE